MGYIFNCWQHSSSTAVQRILEVFSGTKATNEDQIRLHNEIRLRHPPLLKTAPNIRPIIVSREKSKVLFVIISG
jgi:hypothetical protein